MSNVQSPKSGGDAAPVSSVVSQDKPADVGRWTLDVGLSIADLRKSFTSASGEKIEVLRGVSFNAQLGEVIGVVGSSGAGKSTLLHLLGGLEAPDHGSITAGGFAIDREGGTKLAAFRNQHVGFIFQFHHLLPDLTAAENVSLPLRIRRTNAADAMKRARLALEKTGLDSRVTETIVGRLSGGEQQRVAVCRALITQPSLVLADEPTGNLDATSGESIATSLVYYAKHNQAVVIVATHNPSMAELCDRALLLDSGRITEVASHS
ncbi:MAG TPA: ABC transporter ATP-binding protein [Pyrinomonadaceae bacterium]|nr:ABC transporter ATP-binding protein [Pyrinomonadaceae bacterium]